MSITIIALYNLPVLAVAPTAFRMFLLCRTSRVTIMSVSKILSEREMVKYG